MGSTCAVSRCGWRVGGRQGRVSPLGSACAQLLTHEREAGCQLALPLSSHFSIQLLEALHDVPIAHKPVPHRALLARAPVKGLGFYLWLSNWHQVLPIAPLKAFSGSTVVNSLLMHAVKCQCGVA